MSLSRMRMMREMNVYTKMLMDWSKMIVDV